MKIQPEKIRLEFDSPKEFTAIREEIISIFLNIYETADYDIETLYPNFCELRWVLEDI
jgi:hypothetical protein